MLALTCSFCCAGSKLEFLSAVSLHATGMSDDDDNNVPLFTEEDFMRYKANLAAVTDMLDDDDDVPLFDEKACANHATSLHATGMSDDDDDVPLALFDEKARAKD